MEQYLTIVVNPVEKNITEHRSMILAVIWSFGYLIVIILNDERYHFVPINTNFDTLFRIVISDLFSILPRIFRSMSPLLFTYIEFHLYNL
jgi:hypothetical protein